LHEPTTSIPESYSIGSKSFWRRMLDYLGKTRRWPRYEKRIKELKQLLVRKEVEIALLRNFVESSL